MEFIFVNCMDIFSDIYENILTCPYVPPETGGIIGCKNNIICDYLYDEGLNTKHRAIYIPDVIKLNSAIQLWKTKDILFAGIFHSHPTNQPELSSSDIKYIHNIFDSMPQKISFLYFPVVIPTQTLLPFLATRTYNGIHIKKDTLKIIWRKTK